MLKNQIHIRVTNQIWQIIYCYDSNINETMMRFDYDNNLLFITHKKLSTATISAINTQIETWLLHKSKAILSPWLYNLSTITGLNFTALKIKAHKSLWGSCTYNKTINLNYKLIFLPFKLCRYVLLHELCHLKHLNHKKSFWELLTKFEPHARKLDKALKHVNPDTIQTSLNLEVCQALE